MSAVTCQKCRELLPDDAAFCPHCGAPIPDAPAAFVLQASTDDTSDELFAKPKEQTALSRGPILVGVAALFIVVAAVIALSGTGSNIASAPTPTPEPSPTPDPQPPAPTSSARDESAESDTAPDDAAALAGGEGESTDSTESSVDAPPDDVRFQFESFDEDYVTVLRSLAESNNLRGTVVFATANEATRLDLETGEVTAIPLEERRFLLGGHTGILSADPGRSVIAQRWDAPNKRIEVAAGYYDTLGSPWVDPNGWELVSHSASGRYFVMAPWETASPDSPNIPVTPQDGNEFSYDGPVDTVSSQPRQWTWNDGWVALPWDEVLALQQDHLLVRTCEAPGECTHVVVDKNQNVLFTVDESIAASELETHLGLLSSGSLTLMWSGNGEVVKFEIVNLETGSRTLLPWTDIVQAYWLDDLLVMVNFTPQGQTHLVLDRTGAPIVELVWPGSSDDLKLSYFAPETSTAMDGG